MSNIWIILAFFETDKACNVCIHFIKNLKKTAISKTNPQQWSRIPVTTSP